MGALKEFVYMMAGIGLLAAAVGCGVSSKTDYESSATLSEARAIHSIEAKSERTRDLWTMGELSKWEEEYKAHGPAAGETKKGVAEKEQKLKGLREKYPKSE